MKKKSKVGSGQHQIKTQNLHRSQKIFLEMLRAQPLLQGTYLERKQRVVVLNLCLVQNQQATEVNPYLEPNLQKMAVNLCLEANQLMVEVNLYSVPSRLTVKINLCLGQNLLIKLRLHQVADYLDKSPHQVVGYSASNLLQVVVFSELNLLQEEAYLELKHPQQEEVFLVKAHQNKEEVCSAQPILPQVEVFLAQNQQKDLFLVALKKTCSETLAIIFLHKIRMPSRKMRIPMPRSFKRMKRLL